MRKLIKRYLAGNIFDAVKFTPPKLDESMPNTGNIGGNALGIDWSKASGAEVQKAKDMIAGPVKDIFGSIGGGAVQSVLPKGNFFNNMFKGMGGTSGLVSLGSNLVTSMLPERVQSDAYKKVLGALNLAKNIPGVGGLIATGLSTALEVTDWLGQKLIANLNDSQETQDTLANTGGGYGDFMSSWDEAKQYAGKNAGFWTGTSKYNNMVYDANRKMSKLQGIIGQNMTNNFLTALMGDRWNERTMMDMNGGLGNISFGQKGIKISRKNVATAKRVSSTVNRKPSFHQWYRTLPAEKNDTVDYDLEAAFNELSKTSTGWTALEKFRTDPNAHLDGRFKKPTHPTYDENLDEDYRGQYGWFGSDATGWSFYPSPRLLLLRAIPEKDGVQWYKEYWDLFEPESTLVIGEYGKQPIWSYNRSPLKLSEFDINPSSVEVPNSLYVNKPIIFEKEGGKMNVIPEGSLHARLHHMENADGLTKKGIPVVSIAEGGELEQLAEIELNEIIFRLEVTQELEKLMEDGSDNAAIEAGKLLVKEIFENTDDRTGLIKLLEPERKETTTEDIVKNHQVF